MATTPRKKPAATAEPTKPAAAAAKSVSRKRSSKAIDAAATLKPVAQAAKTASKANRKTVKAKATEVDGGEDLRQRMYVLDTNVLLHDPLSVFKFQEHAVYIPMVTLEELDNKKQGTNDINRHAREATRRIEEITTTSEGSLKHGYDLSPFNGNIPGGLLIIQQAHLGFLEGETTHKNDNLYLAVLAHLERAYPQNKIVMVTKDLNLRVKARAMGHRAEDYKHDHAVEDAKIFFSGIHHRDNAWLHADETQATAIEDKSIRYLKVVAIEGGVTNEFVHITDTNVLYQIVGSKNGFMILEEKNPGEKAFGVKPRNEEQVAAMALLLDPSVDLVALLGPAGTGKTLLTLAAGLQQTLDPQGGKLFDEIIFTRATVALGEEVGFLPGNEEEKMMPWLGALTDNVEVLAETQAKGGNKGGNAKSLKDQVMEVVRPRAMTFMRGRSFLKKLLIIDEAQNLTPKQMKALVTRAGDGTKVIFMGNLAQIDSPYLSEQSSGLSYVVQRFKGWDHFGALILEKGVRSRLATEANARL